MSRTLAMFIIPLLLLACGPAGGKGAAAGAKHAAGPLAIAGISIGMSAAEVEVALKRGGWNSKPYAGDTWKQAIARIVERSKGGFYANVPEGTGGWSAAKAGETLDVSLRPTAGGGRVDRVTYRAPIRGRTSAEFRAELTARYGAPTSQTSRIFRDGMVWCSPGDGGCYGARATPAKPHLTSAYADGSGGRVALILGEGSADAETWNRERDAAVRAASPPSSSF